MKNRFEDLGISGPILKAIEEIGFKTPTDVQAKAIPHILKQRDLIAVSKTGSGKTAVFAITILQLIDVQKTRRPQGLILTPTRELAVQVDRDIKQLARYLPHRTTAVYGQHSMNVEMQALKKGVSIVAGTPGRVYDHIHQRNLLTKDIRFLVLDEADRMLDMGFIDQVVKIIKLLPRNRVTMLFSATIPPEIRRICSAYMRDPVTIEVESQTKTVDTIKQKYFRVKRNEKRTQLDRILTIERPESCLIFCNTKIAVNQIQNYLSRKGYACRALHGDIPQGKRMKTMQQFKNGIFNILIATDVASRGIHIEDLSLVLNYDIPNEMDNYVHRIGRTGRAGKGGHAITLATDNDFMTLYEIEEHIGVLIEEDVLPSDKDIEANRTEAAKWKKCHAHKSRNAQYNNRQNRKKSGYSHNRKYDTQQIKSKSMPEHDRDKSNKENQQVHSTKPHKLPQQDHMPCQLSPKKPSTVKSIEAPVETPQVHETTQTQFKTTQSKQPLFRRLVDRILGK